MHFLYTSQTVPNFFKSEKNIKKIKNKLIVCNLISYFSDRRSFIALYANEKHFRENKK
jgi:hypothetical protein